MMRILSIIFLVTCISLLSAFKIFSQTIQKSIQNNKNTTPQSNSIIIHPLDDDVYLYQTQGKHKRDSLRRTVISLGYQPAIGGDMFGAGIYIHSLVSIVGVYSSMTGLYTQLVGDRSTKMNDNDTPVGASIPSSDWNTINFGISIQTAPNFFIYCGYSIGKYSVWATTKYKHTYSTGFEYYTIVEEDKSSKQGADFGAMYYAGKGVLRFGLQLGFNTSMKSIIAGIQLGVFIK
ncbi:MAG: hypothetical protein ACOYM0_01350 [Bacteroidales bacterium]